MSPVPRSAEPLDVWIVRAKQQGDEGFLGRNWTELNRTGLPLGRVPCYD